MNRSTTFNVLAFSRSCLGSKLYLGKEQILPNTHVKNLYVLKSHFSSNAKIAHTAPCNGGSAAVLLGVPYYWVVQGSKEIHSAFSFKFSCVLSNWLIYLSYLKIQKRKTPDNQNMHRHIGKEWRSFETKLTIQWMTMKPPLWRSCSASEWFHVTIQSCDYPHSAKI